MVHKTILITRAKGDEGKAVKILQKRGYHVIHEPLTHILLYHTARTELEQVLFADPDGIIVSSKHGVHALAALTQLRDLPLICVGDSTAYAAQSLGFTRVSKGGDTMGELVNYVVDAYDSGTCFLYVSGQHIRLDVTQELAVYGIEARRVILYEATAAAQLSDTLVEQLKRGQVDAVLFMSARTAEIFHTLLKAADVAEAMASMQAFCLSRDIADKLTAYFWQAIHIATKPTLASLIECVDNAPLQKTS